VGEVLELPVPPPLSLILTVIEATHNHSRGVQFEIHCVDWQRLFIVATEMKEKSSTEIPFKIHH